MTAIKIRRSLLKKKYQENALRVPERILQFQFYRIIIMTYEAIVRWRSISNSLLVVGARGCLHKFGDLRAAFYDPTRFWRTPLATGEETLRKELGARSSRIIVVRISLIVREEFRATREHS